MNFISLKRNWIKTKLGNVAEEIRELVEPNKTEAYPYIGLEHIEQQTLKLKDVGSSDDVVSTKKVFKEGDILFGSLRPYFRKVVRPTFSGVCSTDITVIRAKNNTDTAFLYYFIASQDFIDYSTNISSGTRMPRASWKVLSESEWYFPPLSTQRKIASILTAYDELIENNLRRIKILEEMAQALYREWFVHYRFPGHEKVRLVDSPLGKIPEGWRVEKLGNIIELNYGKGLPKEKRREGCVPVYGSSGIVGYHDRSIVDGPGIIVGRKGNVGSVFWSDTDFYPIDTVYYVSSELPLRYLFYDLQTRNFINNDAAVPGLNRKQAYSLETILPTPELMDKFCNITEAFGKQASILRNKNEILRRTRDLLLPKLISGEIDVSELDIKVPEELD